MIMIYTFDFPFSSFFSFNFSSFFVITLSFYNWFIANVLTKNQTDKQTKDKKIFGSLVFQISSTSVHRKTKKETNKKNIYI